MSPVFTHPANNALGGGFLVSPEPGHSARRTGRQSRPLLPWAAGCFLHSRFLSVHTAAACHRREGAYCPQSRQTTASVPSWPRAALRSDHNPGRAHPRTPHAPREPSHLQWVRLLPAGHFNPEKPRPRAVLSLTTAFSMVGTMNR